ncbi:hypothetical protein D3C81_1356520 [compost metagenome]
MILCTFTDVDQLQRAAAAQLFGQRTAEAFQRTLRTGRERIAQGFRRPPEQHQMRAVIEVFHQRLEEFAQLFELVGVHQVTGVEHHGFEFRPVAGNPCRRHRRLGAVAVDRIGQAVGECADFFCQRPATDQQRTFHRTQPARLPALQPRG